MSRLLRLVVRRALLATALSGCFATACFGIDNPDAPDLMAQFQARASVYEARIRAEPGTTNDIVAAYASYESFLSAELTQSYHALAKKLAPAPREKLSLSQRQWQRYRDAEFQFIEKNWTQGEFGTSAALSRGAYRASIVKDRIAALIQYLKNYP
jgi:uncharacterized protein YecT (DUF1311 family)